MRAKLILSLFILLMIPLTLAARSTDGYEKVLYPDGMPASGRTITEYEFLAEYVVPDSNDIIVFYSENEGHPGGDTDIPRTIFVGVLNKDGEKLSVREKLDITKLLFGNDDYALDEGCKEISGSIKDLDLFTDRKAFVFSFYVLISGTGRIDHDSVFVFELDENNTPRNIWSIYDTSGFGRWAKDSYSIFNTDMHLVKGGRDGQPEIITQKREILHDACEGEYRDMVQDGYSVYEYSKEDHVFKKSDTIYELPKDAVDMYPSAQETK